MQATSRDTEHTWQTALTWIGERQENEALLRAARLVDKALDRTIALPERRTVDLGGPAGTSAFTGYVVDEMRVLSAGSY